MASALRGDDAILKIHRESADEAFNFLERYAATRIRKAGSYSDRRTGNLLSFATEHETSRHGDPHLHTHFVVPNLTWDDTEKRYKALQTGLISEYLPLASAIYRNLLAQKLENLGYKLEFRPDGKFEISGIPDTLIREYSKGKLHIDEQISEIEYDNKRELKESDRRKIALGLRPKKMDEVEEKNAIEGFRNRVKALGFGEILHPTKAESLRFVLPFADPIRVKKAMVFTVEHKFERDSTCRESKFLECAVSHLAGKTSYEKVFSEYENMLSGKKLLRASNRVTTSEMLEIEKRLIKFAEKSIGVSQSFAETAKHSWNFPSQLSAEQGECLKYVMFSRDRITNVQGIAGAGKSFMLRALAANLKAQKVGFIAVAPSNKATAELSELGDGNSQTMQKLILRGGDERLRSGLLIVDEAGLVGVRDMDKLFKIAQKYNAEDSAFGRYPPAQVRTRGRRAAPSANPQRDANLCPKRNKKTKGKDLQQGCFVNF